jgi:CRISPR/Cas system-associated exonuclease Cas4 (RecB family)
VLQKGGLSKDKKQASTKRRYLAKIHELGLKVEDYADFLAVWEEPKFHCRESVSRSITHLQNFEKNLTDEIREISSTRTKIVYNDSKQCIYCDYRPLCEEVNNGGDWKLIKQLDYKLVVVGNSPESEIDNDEV